jgi:hypothetical protein
MEWVIVLALVALILYMLTDESFGEADEASCASQTLVRLHGRRRCL